MPVGRFDVSGAAAQFVWGARLRTNQSRSRPEYVRQRIPCRS